MILSEESINWCGENFLEISANETGSFDLTDPDAASWVTAFGVS